jgi:hypothetical protein
MSIDNCQVCDKGLDTDHIEYQGGGTLLCDGCLDEMENEQYEPVAEPKQCKCSLRTALVGDGCEVCNPAQSLEYCRENLAEAVAERDRYKALAGELAEALEHLTGPKECWCEADTKDSRLQFHTWECNTARAALAKYEQEKGV